MPRRLTRRSFLLQGSAAAIAGTAAVAGLRLGERPSRAQSEDLVDQGESFRAGEFDGTHLVATQDGWAVTPLAGGGSFTSRVLTASMLFSHAGLHWDAQLTEPGDLTVAFRSSEGGAAWSEWRTPALERRDGEAPAPGNFASVTHVGEARYLQYRASFSQDGPAAPLLRRVTATVIDSRPQGPRVERLDTVRATTSAAAQPGQFRSIVSGVSRDGPVVPPGQPDPQAREPQLGLTLDVVSRELWGADESYRFNAQGREIWQEMFVPAKKLIVHHSAGRNSYGDASEAAADVRAIHLYHSLTQGWGDMGYQALIDRFGNVYEGRHGRGGDPGDPWLQREVMSAGVSGGGSKWHNYGAQGYALLGDSTADDWPMPDPSGPMWEGLVRLLTFEARRYFVPLGQPGAPVPVSDYLRSDDQWREAFRNLSGHRESEQTTCPGDVVLALLPAMRDAVVAGIVGTSRTGALITSVVPGDRELSPGTSINFQWQAEGPENGWSVTGFDTCLEGWLKPEDSDDLAYLSGYTPERQPYIRWRRVTATSRSAAFQLTAPGHYTFHVLPVLTKGTDVRTAAYEANHTVLVK